MSASASQLSLGQTAPNWTAQAMGVKGEYTLSAADLKGQAYILYFYPKDNTPGCTTQACDFRDHMGRLETLGYKVIGCSPDSLKSHSGFQAKQNFSFDLLTDPEHQVSEQFGVWREKKNYGRTYMGIVRSTFVVNAEGIVTHLFDNVRAKGHVERLITALSELS